MRSVARLWRKLTEPQLEVHQPELRRRSRLLLTVVVVCAILWSLIFAYVLLLSLVPLGFAQRRTVTVFYPVLLLALSPAVPVSYLLARRGRERLAARAMVVVVVLAGWTDVFVTGDASVLGIPLIALVMSSVLLSPRDTLLTFGALVAGYLVAVALIPGLTLWSIHATLIAVVAIGGLVTAAVAVRETDLKQIAEQADALAKAHDRVLRSRQLEAVARLSAGLAHEFNNIMTAIQGYADLVKDHPGAPASAYAERIREASGRAVRLTDGLLSFSEQQLLNPTSVNLDDFLASRELMFRRVVRDPSRLVLRFSPERKKVLIDVNFVSDALRALVLASEKGMPEGDTLRITTDLRHLGEANPLSLSPGGYACVVIRDNGPASRGKSEGRVFEPFFTLGEFGTGNLDLASAYGIIRQAGGGVDCFAEAAGGNSFLVLIPLADQGVRRPPADSASPLR